MLDHPNLLVVDDETTICEACRRTLSPQGYRVETSSSAPEGLAMATEGDYDAVLLDVMMPELNGLEFLSRLRGKKRDLPVIVITGYPSVSDAASAMRLGVSDYLTKPFTPQEITRAVEGLVGRPQPFEKSDVEQVEKSGPDLGTAAAAPAEPDLVAPAAEFRFWGRSWCETGAEGPVRVGAAWPPSSCVSAEAVQLPKVGEVVYQGLPLAGLTAPGEPPRIVPSPLSGVVVEVNSGLEQSLSMLLEDPYGDGWIARVAPTRFEGEKTRCRPRRVVLVNADPVSGRSQCAQLRSQGCQVQLVASGEDLGPADAIRAEYLVLIDEVSLDRQGPELAGRIRAAARGAKIVVIGAGHSLWEAAYRKQGIFYYTVLPFGDREIVDILDAVFVPRKHPADQDRPGIASDTVSRIVITNHDGKTVCLLVAGGLLSNSDGLGWWIRRKLLDDQLCPLRTCSGIGRMSQLRTLASTTECDRLVLLIPADMGRLPGTLVRDTRSRFIPNLSVDDVEVTGLVVQPESPRDGLTGFDEATMTALADHVIAEMASS